MHIQDGEWWTILLEYIFKSILKSNKVDIRSCVLNKTIGIFIANLLNCFLLYYVKLMAEWNFYNKTSNIIHICLNQQRGSDQFSELESEFAGKRVGDKVHCCLFNAKYL